MLKKKIDLVILAGGKGSRIKKLTKNFPKPLVKFNKISFLQYLINYYAQFNFRYIFILAGYKGKQLKNKYHNKEQNFVKIKCFVEKKPLGTGGALNLIKKKISKNFFLINGDTYLEPNIEYITNKIKLKKKLGLMNVIDSDNKNIKLNNLKIFKNEISFTKKSTINNSGVYFFKKNIFDYIKKKKISLENEILPELINKNKILGLKYKKYFIDIGTNNNFFKAKKFLPKLLSRPAVFLDRDGVINYDHGYVHTIKKFHFKKGVIKALKYLNKKKYFIFIVTNQAGISKGIFSIRKFFTLHRWIKDTLSKKNIFINDVEYCPHHLDGKIKKYKIKCNCRKPNNGMIKKLESKWLIDHKKSFFVGDKVSDQNCAKKSKIKFFFTEKNLFSQIKKIDNKV
jgi:D,D-heptose 1,7-bisphosphate phosphatase